MRTCAWFVGIGLVACGGQAVESPEIPVEPVPAENRDPLDRATGDFPLEEDLPALECAALTYPSKEALCGDGAAVWRDESFATVQEAVDRSDDGDVVYVCPGTWWGRIDVEDQRLEIRATTPNTAVMSGQGLGNVVRATNSVLTLEGFEIRNGRTSEGGGGVSALVSDLQLHCMMVRDNADASSGGGGVFSDGGALLVRSSTFLDNTAAQGSAILVGLGWWRGERDVHAVISHSTFVESENASSGSVVMVDTPTKQVLRILDTEFTQFTGRMSVIDLQGTDEQALTIERTRFAENAGEAVVEVSSEGPTSVVLRDTQFEDNAVGFKSALSLTTHNGGLAVVIDDTSFLGNTDQQWPNGPVALDIRSSGDLDLDVSGSHFAGNLTSSDAVIALTATNLDASIRETRFEGNTAREASVMEVSAMSGGVELVESQVVSNAVERGSGAALRFPSSVAVTCINCDLGEGDTENQTYDVAWGDEQISAGAGASFSRP